MYPQFSVKDLWRLTASGIIQIKLSQSRSRTPYLKYVVVMVPVSAALQCQGWKEALFKNYVWKSYLCTETGTQRVENQNRLEQAVKVISGLKDLRNHSAPTLKILGLFPH